MGRLFAITALFIVGIFVAASVYYMTSSGTPGMKTTADAVALSARKEDLLATQLQIQDQINTLKKSVDLTIQQQQDLNAQVSALKQKISSGSSNSGTQATPPTPTTVAPTPDPAPTPVPAPVPVYIPPTYTPPTTRAS